MKTIWRSLTGLIIAICLLPLFTLADQDQLTELKEIVEDNSYGNYWDRRKAIPKLGKIGTEKSTQILIELLGDQEEPIQEAAVMALAKLQDQNTIQWFADKSLTHRNQLVLINAAWALKLIKNEQTLPALIKALKKNKGLARARIIESISFLKNADTAFDDITKHISDGKPEVRAAVAEALGRIKNSAGYDILMKKRHDSRWPVKANILSALAILDPKKALPELKEALTDRAPQVRIAALNALSAIDKESVWLAAVAALEDKAWSVRAAAIGIFRTLKDKRAVDILNRRAPEEKWRLRYDIKQALRELAKIDTPADETIARFFDIPVYGKNIIFIIDFSGSMKYQAKKKDPRKKIEIARAELGNTLEKFKVAQRFNVILMSTEAIKINKRNIAPRMVASVEGNKKLAMKFVDSIWDQLEDIKRGRGDMYDALMEAFQEEKVDTIFILSDGKPTYGKYVYKKNFLENLKKNNRYRKIVVHTVLTGRTGTEAKFMKDIAEVTGGMFMRK